MTCTLKSNWNKIKNCDAHEINVLRKLNRIRTEMYTKINVVKNHMNFKISSLKVEMSKEINVTKYEGDIEEKLKLTLLM